MSVVGLLLCNEHRRSNAKAFRWPSCSLSSAGNFLWHVADAMGNRCAEPLPPLPAGRPIVARLVLLMCSDAVARLHTLSAGQANGPNRVRPLGALQLDPNGAPALVRISRNRIGSNQTKQALCCHDPLDARNCHLCRRALGLAKAASAANLSDGFGAPAPGGLRDGRPENFEPALTNLPATKFSNSTRTANH